MPQPVGHFIELGSINDGTSKYLRRFLPFRREPLYDGLYPLSQESHHFFVGLQDRSRRGFFDYKTIGHEFARSVISIRHTPVSLESSEYRHKYVPTIHHHLQHHVLE